MLRLQNECNSNCLLVQNFKVERSKLIDTMIRLKIFFRFRYKFLILKQIIFKKKLNLKIYFINILSISN
jgi:hypothetical protein